MNRTIKLIYAFNEDKTMITIYLTDESDNSITRYVGEYIFDKFNNSVDFYNTLLERYDAEYDDDLANVLEDLSNKLVKEGVYDE